MIYWFRHNKNTIDMDNSLGIDVLMRSCADPEGGQGVRTPPPPLKTNKNIGFLSNTGPDPLGNHKDTKPAINLGPSSARQRNANGVSLLCRWWPAYKGIWILPPLINLNWKKKQENVVLVGPPLTNFLDPRMAMETLKRILSKLTRLFVHSDATNSTVVAWFKPLIRAFIFAAANCVMTINVCSDKSCLKRRLIWTWNVLVCLNDPSLMLCLAWSDFMES